MKRIILMLIFIGFYSKSFSQEHHTIGTTTKKHEFWGKKGTDYYVDTTGLQKFQDVLIKDFEPTFGKSPNFGLSNDSFWIRFKLLKDTKNTNSYIIGSTFSTIDSLEYFLIDDKNKIIEHKYAGRLVSHHTQEIESQDKVFALNIKNANVYTIYIRMAGNTPKRNSIMIEETHQYYADYQKQTLFFAGYIGFYITMIMVQLVFYLITKNKNSLYYMLYLIAFLFVEFTRGNGLFGDLYIWSEYKWLKSNSLLIFVNISTILGMWFYANGLKLKTYSKLMFQILLFDAFLSFFITLKTLFLSDDINKLFFPLILSLFSDLLVLVACIIVWKKGYKPARYYTLGTLFFFLGIIISTIWNFGFLPDSFIINNSLNFGCIIEMLFFTTAIADEYKQNQKEKQNIQKSMIKVLENKNAEISEALLRGQTTERHRVAIDLHDNLGSTLSSIGYSMEAIDKTNMNETEKNIYKSLQEMVDKAYNDVRLLSHNLLPEEFEKQGLVPTLQSFVRKISKNSQIRFDLQITEGFGRVDNKIEFELYSICLELVNNIIKHSKATDANISLSRTEKQIELIVSDNGIGTFNNESDGKGMKNVKARVESLNGVWRFQNIENQGVVNNIVIPV